MTFGTKHIKVSRSGEFGSDEKKFISHLLERPVWNVKGGIGQKYAYIYRLVQYATTSADYDNRLSHACRKLIGLMRDAVV